MHFHPAQVPPLASLYFRRARACPPRERLLYVCHRLLLDKAACFCDRLP
jgi:hypothetical protein